MQAKRRQNQGSWPVDDAAARHRGCKLMDRGWTADAAHALPTSLHPLRPPPASTPSRVHADCAACGLALATTLRKGRKPWGQQAPCPQTPWACRRLTAPARAPLFYSRRANRNPGRLRQQLHTRACKSKATGTTARPCSDSLRAGRRSFPRLPPAPATGALLRVSLNSPGDAP